MSLQSKNQIYDLFQQQQQHILLVGEVLVFMSCFHCFPEAGCLRVDDICRKTNLFSSAFAFEFVDIAS